MCWSLRRQHADLVAGLGVGRTTQGREQVVGVGAVADGRRLLLESANAVAGRFDAGDRAAHVAAGADLGGHGGDQPLFGDEIAQVALEPWGIVEVANDRGHLDLVHRKHHRARAAPLAELEARSRDRLERDAVSAKLGGDEGGKRLLRAQSRDRLGGKASVAIDRTGVWRRDLIGDHADGI